MSVLWEIPKDDKEHIMKRRELVMKIHDMLGQLKLWVAASKTASNVDVGVDIDLGDLDAATPGGATADGGMGEGTSGMTGGEVDEETNAEIDEEEEEEEGEEMDERTQLAMYGRKFGLTDAELYGETSENDHGMYGENDPEYYSFWDAR